MAVGLCRMCVARDRVLRVLFAGRQVRSRECTRPGERVSVDDVRKDVGGKVLKDAPQSLGLPLRLGRAS